ncbi:hypothetical protein PLICRDRAFT_47894 [Plicaturopsis crispa FD-325 SS-3]|nr:hypothetical protein PLICRDRAFT_47894 [Plicaturopsis crispa FD-325 SS-3]
MEGSVFSSPSLEQSHRLPAERLHSCRWAWCRLSFATLKELAHHVVQDHAAKAQPVRRKDLELIRRVEEGVGQSLSLNMSQGGGIWGSQSQDVNHDISGPSQQPNSAAPTSVPSPRHASPSTANQDTRAHSAKTPPFTSFQALASPPRSPEIPMSSPPASPAFESLVIDAVRQDDEPSPPAHIVDFAPDSGNSSQPLKNALANGEAVNKRVVEIALQDADVSMTSSCGVVESLTQVKSDWNGEASGSSHYSSQSHDQSHPEFYDEIPGLTLSSALRQVAEIVPNSPPMGGEDPEEDLELQWPSPNVGNSELDSDEEPRTQSQSISQDSKTMPHSPRPSQPNINGSENDSQARLPSESTIWTASTFSSGKLTVRPLGCLSAGG